MNIEKKIIGKIPKCYAVAPLVYHGKEHLLVSAERKGPCNLYDLRGNEEATLWVEPGGVMTMLQIPGTDGQFLATHEFYSPHDAANARIVVVTPQKDGTWDIRTLMKLPYVHRFGILEQNGTKYFIACTVKSGQDTPKDDWSYPGKVYGALLPDDFSRFDESHPLTMEVIMDGMVKNHGYTKTVKNGVETAVISCDSGVYLFAPPAEPGASWEITKILDEPASDGVLVDLDGDGLDELAVISPFHGDRICIYHEQDGKFIPVYRYEKPAPFAHSIFGGMICGRPSVVIGHREGERNLILFMLSLIHISEPTRH